MLGGFSFAESGQFYHKALLSINSVDTAINDRHCTNPICCAIIITEPSKGLGIQYDYYSKTYFEPDYVKQVTGKLKEFFGANL